MKAISEVLKKIAPIKISGSPKQRNRDWEAAEEFGAYVKIPTLMIMHLFRVYGKARVLGLRGWLRDVPNRNPKTFYGLAIWKLKEDLKQNQKLVFDKQLNK